MTPAPTDISDRVPPIRFTLRQIECFVAVAETGSISAAAGRLRASDSAVSDALTAIERSLNATLVRRRRAQGATLTSDGLALLPIARRMLTDAEELASVVGPGASALRGPVRVGTVGTLGPTLLPRLIRAMADRHPGVRIEYLLADLPTLTAAIEDGRLDIAIAFDIDIPPELSKIPMYSTEACLIVGSEHPLAGRDQASLAEVADEPMVLLDIETSRVHTLELMSSRGIQPRISHRTDSFSLCTGLVGRGLGYSLLMWREGLDRTMDGGRITALRITPPPRRVDVALITSATRRPPRLAAFIEMARAMYSDSPATNPEGTGE